MDRPTKKLLKKLDKKVPGLSVLFNPKKLFGLDKNQNELLEIAASFLLMADKAGKKKASRRQFSKIVKQKVLIRQNFRCKSCLNPLEIVDFDHIDGDTSNNDISNCQALCPNCHAKKTRNKRGLRSS